MVKYNNVRAILALFTQFSGELDQLDVKIAFFHGELDEQIYMKQLLGFMKGNQENVFCLLKKSLYDLKQTQRQWYKRFNSSV